MSPDLSPDLPPDLPPDAPAIPVGLGTILGIAFSVLAAIAAALSSLFEGDQTPETIALIVAALGAAYKVLDGRYNQATAAVVASPQMAAAPYFHDLEVEEMPHDDPSLGEPGDEPLPPEGGIGGKAGEA